MSELKENYTFLAALYDVLMEDVDYESWADFIDEIIQTHHPEAVDLLEMACGTGSLSLSLGELECYNILASDKSVKMIEIARKKPKDFNSTVDFITLDFLDIDVDQSFDCIFTVFDSVNYLMNAEQIKKFLIGASKKLNGNGLLIFDFSTPKNSLESVDYLNENEGDNGRFRFFRKSAYDPKQKIHRNEFEIEEIDIKTGNILQTVQEIHEQRAYSLDQMLSIVEQTPYHLVAKYDGFDLIDANENSARVTMVLQC
ncbi:MAG: class I SAM-dependent methyltransferase [Balneola sp.]|nr:MAG: class I SAM-dependent methyltransferase [Balneola sp.]